MRSTDAARIAWTKFKARRVRTSLSAIITAIVLTLLVCVAYGYSGIRGSLSDIDGLSNESNVLKLSHIQSVYFEGAVFDETSFYDEVNGRLDKAKELYSDYDIVDFSTTSSSILSVAGSSIKIDGKLIESQSTTQFSDFSYTYTPSYFNIGSRPDEYLASGLFDGHSIESLQQDQVPLFISSDSLLAISNTDIDDKKTEQKVQIMSELYEQYKGKELVLSADQLEAKTLKFVIVGYAPADSLFSNFFYDSNSSYVPQSILNDELKSLFDDFYSISEVGYELSFDPELGQVDGSAVDNSIDDIVAQSRYIDGPLMMKFADQDEMKRFIEEESCRNNYNSISCAAADVYQNVLVEFDEEFKSIWGFLKYIVYFFAGIAATFIFFTTSKVLSESTRETGVFRAMGAKRSDITKIYLIYTMIITSFAYVLALIIGVVLMLIIQGSEADSLSILATNITGSYASPVEISFVGFNLAHLAFIWLASILIGVIGGIFPILGNVYRDPIKAMRSE